MSSIVILVLINCAMPHMLKGTPLHNACYSGSTKTVTYLLEKGADPTAVDDDGENSLSWAICSRQR